MGMKMSLDEQMTNQNTLGHQYYKKYQEVMEVLQDSPRAKVRPMTNFDYHKVGHAIEQQNRWIKIHEEAGTIAALGPIPNVAMRVIALKYGASPLGELAAEQPMKTRSGFALFKDFEASHTRGNVSKGQKLSSALGAPDVHSKSYTNNTVKDEPLLQVADGDSLYEIIKIGGTDDLMGSLYNRDMTLRASVIFTTANGPVVFPPMPVDPASGNFSAVGDNGGSPCWIRGKVDFDAGEVQNLEFSSNPDGATNVYITYQVLIEGAIDVPRGHLKFQDKPIRAEWYALASDYGLFEQFTMMNEYDLNIEELIINDLTFAMNNEQCNKLIGIIHANIPETNLVTWERKPLTGTSSLEHAHVLDQALNDAEDKLMESAERGTVTCWAVGRKLATRFRDLPDFKLLYEKDTYGPHIYGTYNGKTIVRFPAQDVLDPNTGIGIGKLSDYEAPGFVGEYMPLTAMETLPQSDNPLRRQRAVGSAMAIESMVPTLSTRIVMDDANYTFGTPSE